MAEIQRDITRVVLAVLFIVALIGSSIWILRPFLGAIVWAATIVVATWSLMIGLQTWLWGKRALAVTVMTLFLLCIMVLPLTFAIGTIVSNVDDIVEWVKSLGSFRTPSAPQWVADLPFIGTKAVELWERVAAAGINEVAMRAAPYAGIFIGWFVAQVGNIGVLLAQFLLTVIIAAVMYANGELATQRLVRFGRRPSRRSNHPRCCPWRRRDRPSPNDFCWSRPGNRRRAFRRGTHCSDAPFVDCADRGYPGAWMCGWVALLDRRLDLGNILAGLDDSGGNHG